MVSSADFIDPDPQRGSMDGRADVSQFLTGLSVLGEERFPDDFGDDGTAAGCGQFLSGGLSGIGVSAFIPIMSD